MHVKKSEWIWFLLANQLCAVFIHMKCVAVEPCVVLQLQDVISKAPRRCCACTTGKFPLGFTRKTVFVFVFSSQSSTKLHSIIPIDKRRREVLALYERIVEGKEDIPEVVEPLNYITKQQILTSNLNFDKLIADLKNAEQIWHQHVEIDDEEILLLL